MFYLIMLILLYIQQTHFAAEMWEKLRIDGKKSCNSNPYNI